MHTDQNEANVGQKSQKPTPSQAPLSKGKSFFASNDTMTRAMIILGIILFLMIPLGYVGGLVTERAESQQAAISDIVAQWGEAQQITGPFLVIPYDGWVITTAEQEEPKTGKRITKEIKEKSARYWIILPDQFDVVANIIPMERYFGIYRYRVFEAPVSLKGIFSLPDKEVLGDQVAAIHFDKAFIALGVTDLRAITSVSELVINGEKRGHFLPGGKIDNLARNGIHVVLPLESGKTGAQSFQIDLSLRGSGSIAFTPVGKVSQFSIAGQWSSPSFTGGISPTKREITDTRFSAFWSIPYLSRAYPQTGPLEAFMTGESSRTAVDEFSIGVSLYEPVTLYSQVDRSIKYGILFIGLTFSALFGFELIRKRRLHFLQYGLVGLSLCIFYLTLLSLAEHTPFWIAFLAASAITILMNSLYIGVAIGSVRQGGLIALLLGFLYLALYVLLQMETFAFLAGTIVILVVMAGLMFATRKLPVGGHEAA